MGRFDPEGRQGLGAVAVAVAVAETGAHKGRGATPFLQFLLDLARSLLLQSGVPIALGHELEGLFEDLPELRVSGRDKGDLGDGLRSDPTG